MLHIRLGVAFVRTGLSIEFISWFICCIACIEIVTKQRTGIVIHTIAATKDFLRTTLNILNIGRGLEDIGINCIIDLINLSEIGCVII